MKKLVTILFLLPVAALAQVRNPYGKWLFSPTEYTAGALDSGMHPYTITTDESIGGTNNTGTIGIPQKLSLDPAHPGDSIMAGVQGGLHDGAFWTAGNGRVLTYGQASQCQLGNGLTTGPLTAFEIQTDVNGNDFSGITSVTSGWGPVSGRAWYAAIKSDTGHFVWIWGNLADVNGGSTCAKPTPLPALPGGRFTHKIYGYNSSIHCIATDGTVWVMGGKDDYAAATGVNATPSTWTQVVFPGGATIAYLAKGNAFVLAVTTSGDIYGWAELGWICEGLSTNTFTVLTSPTLMNTHLSAIMPVDTIVATHTAWAAKKHDGTIWGAGANEVGVLGIGPTINWNTYTVSPSPTGGTPQFWNWDVGMGEWVTGLTQIAKGKSNFKYLFGGPQFGFYMFAVDSAGNVYVAGRMKAGGGFTGIVPADRLGTRIGSAWHMSWNLVFLTQVYPDSLLKLGAAGQIVVNSPGYEEGLFTGTPGSFGTDAPNRPNTNLHAHLILTPVPGGFTWSGMTSTTDGTHKLLFPHSFITQTSGTTTPLGVRGGGTGVVSAAPGTYGITFTLVDQSFDTVTDVQSVTVTTAAQTKFYFSGAGSGTSCDTLHPCPATYFNTAFASAVPGDTFYLNRGDVFPVEIVANASGSAGNPIVVRPYGSGADPYIGGMTDLTGTWTNVGANLWSAPLTTPWPKLLASNSRLWHVAQTPDAGYYIATGQTINTITDAANSGTVTAGDTLVNRPSAFTFNKRKVSSVSAGLITVSSNFTYTGQGGIGWFKINTTPDAPSEYLVQSGSVEVYSLTTPTGISVPTVDTALLSEGVYQEFDSIHFGGNNSGIILAFQGASHNLFNGVTIDYSFDAVQLRSEGSVSFLNCKFRHLTDMGVQKQNLNNYNNTYIGDSLVDIGMNPGMGGDGNQFRFYTGLEAGDSGSVVSHCYIDSMGYCGVTNFGSGFVVDSNSINHVCQILEDGAGIYTWINTLPTWADSPRIIGNYVNGSGSATSHLGSSLDSSSTGNCIYLDDMTRGVLVAHNKVVGATSCGYYDHGPGNVFLYDTSFNSGYSEFLAFECAACATISNLVVKYCSFNGVSRSDNLLHLETVTRDLLTFGFLDSNSLNHQSSASSLYAKDNTGGGVNMSLTAWQSLYGFENHSNFGQLFILYAGNPWLTPKVVILPGVYKDASGVYRNKISLPAISGRPLQLVNLGFFWRFKSK